MSGFRRWLRRRWPLALTVGYEVLVLGGLALSGEWSLLKPLNTALLIAVGPLAIAIGWLWVKRRKRQDRVPVVSAYTYDVFLSYSTKDTDEANRVRDQLENSNLSCFMASQDIQGGDSWSDVIRNGLLHSREICILVTVNSLSSDWVSAEWGAAWVLQRRVVPLLQGVASGNLPHRLRNVQTRNFSDLGKYIGEVARRREEGEG